MQGVLKSFSVVLLVAAPVLPAWAQGAGEATTAAPAATAAEAVPATHKAIVEGHNRKLADMKSEDDMSIYVVQKRAYSKKGRFEVTPFFFTKVNPKFVGYYGAGVSVAYHIMENFAVELSSSLPYVYNAFYSDLVYEVWQYNSLTPQDVDLKQMTYFGAADLQFSALYGKFIFYKWLLDYDFYVTGGLGVVSTQETCTPSKDGCSGVVDIGRGLRTPKSTGDQLKLAGNLGAGMRVFFADYLGLRLELRDISYSDHQNFQNIVTTDIRNNLMVFVGVSFLIPGPATLAK